jgi:rubrerythrin
MRKSDTIEILKNAILLERRGRAFYKKIAEQAENQKIKAVFEMMADEEQKHMKVLGEQYTAFCTTEKFVPGRFDGEETSDVSSEVLTDAVKGKISAAGFEAAAISAAISMEERAVKLYAESAAAAVDPEAKALYEWLAQWERTHLKFLMDLDKALIESVWFDNRFWPF